MVTTSKLKSSLKDITKSLVQIQTNKKSEIFSVVPGSVLSINKVIDKMKSEINKWSNDIKSIKK